MGMEGVAGGFASFEFLKRLPRGAIVCDIVYNPPQTRLLKAAAALGLKTLNGLGMLIYQALLADEKFLGMELDKPQLKGAVIYDLDNEGNGG
jgi:shikimate dehydrogenase